MVDSLDRWCLFCDLEVHSSAHDGPQPLLDHYVDDLIAMADRGQAKRLSENDSRVTRIAHAKRVNLVDGSPALAMLITLGDRRGADPAFIHFENGRARDAEKMAGEVKGASAHCIVRLTEDPNTRGRYRMFIEETRGIGRTPVTRLIGSVLKDISEDRGEQFKNPKTNRMNAYRPVVEVHPRRSQEMDRALASASFLPVELLDTRPVAVFDANPEYTVRRHVLSIKVKPAQGRTFKQAVSDLAAKAASEGYSHMRVSWRLPGESRGGSSEMRTDLADIGTALFAHRELVKSPTPLSECAAGIEDDFLGAMLPHFV